MSLKTYFDGEKEDTGMSNDRKIGIAIVVVLVCYGIYSYFTPIYKTAETGYASVQEVYRDFNDPQLDVSSHKYVFKYDEHRVEHNKLTDKVSLSTAVAPQTEAETEAYLTLLQGLKASILHNKEDDKLKALNAANGNIVTDNSESWYDKYNPFESREDEIKRINRELRDNTLDAVPTAASIDSLTRDDELDG